jgi:hypothetical protein
MTDDRYDDAGTVACEWLHAVCESNDFATFWRLTHSALRLKWATVLITNACDAPLVPGLAMDLSAEAPDLDVWPDFADRMVADIASHFPTFHSDLWGVQRIPEVVEMDRVKVGVALISSAESFKARQPTHTEYTLSMTGDGDVEGFALHLFLTQDGWRVDGVDSGMEGLTH